MSDLDKLREAAEAALGSMGELRTGHSIIRLANPARTQRPNGRMTLHLEVSVDQMVVDWLRVGRGSAELDCITSAIGALLLEEGGADAGEA